MAAKNRFLLAVGLAVALASCADHAGPERLRVLDLDGKTVDPFQAPDTKAVVLIFVSTDCPISNRYAPETQRLAAAFGLRDVRFWRVYPNADESAAAIRKHTEEYRYTFGALRDPEHQLVAKARARVTPEAAVFLPDGRLVYHGRIDDQFADFGKQRPQPTHRDLRDVLEAILGGKPVAPFATPAIGCSISDIR